MNFSAYEAFELYERLRRLGQTSALARLSVEARLGHLPVAERRRVHSILVEAERERGSLLATTATTKTGG